jgi:predicted ATPase/class 3 adenylate cyclase
LTDYIALDRRWALARGDQLAEQSEGSALFADVSGFTPLTEALVKSLGERRGTETLPHYLNMVYDALINDVNRFYGSVIGFAGDAITCWFDRDDGYRALVCALSMQQSMEQFQDMEVAPGMVVSLAMKVAIAHGPVRRFAVGSPEVQLIDVLAGETLTRMARAEHHAERGDIVLDAHTATRLAERIHVLEWRKATDIPEIPTSNPHLTNNDVTNNDVTNKEVHENGITDGVTEDGVTEDGVTKDGVTKDEVSTNIAATERLAIPHASTEPSTEPLTDTSTDASTKPPTSNLTNTGTDTGTDTFAVIDKVAMGLTVYAHAPESPVESDINPRLPEDDYQALRNWILPPVYDRLKAGQGEFLTELRPTTALFLRFGGLDYDDDPEAGTSLNRFIRWVQGILHDYDGTLIQLTVGDKGSYLYASFGAPTAHEDDTRRALQVALQLRQPPAELGIVDVSIGLAQGTMRTGAYGGSTRRTYGVLGDDVNLAARLMGKAAPGQVLVSERVYQLEASHFQWQDLPRMKVKGKSEPIAVYALVDVTRNQGYIPSSSKLPLIGRQHELEQLTACLARVQQGQGQFALVQGEAGMGKSRLIAAVLEQARNTDGLCRIHTGECQSYGRNSAYLVWQNIWRDLLELDSSAPAQTQISHLQQTISDLSEELLPRLPLLAPLLALPISDNALTASLEPQVRKAATEALLSDLLQALAKRTTNISDTGDPQNPKPQNPNPQNFKQGHFIVLVLEDTQWIDALSADVLSVLVRAVRNLPVLFIATERPSSEGSSVSQLTADLQNAPEGATAVLEVELAELSKADMERLIYSKLRSFDDADAQTNHTGTNHTGTNRAPTSTDTADITSTDTAVNPVETTLPEVTLHRLTERAQGNPFYIEELLNVARAKGLDLHDPGVWATLELPNSLHSLILTRIDQLDERLQITLKVASVIGRSLYAHWLTGYFPELGAPTSVRERLESLCALLLLSKESHLRNVAPDTASDDMFAYVFRQVITRDVAYESLAYQKRAELHERFAHYLEQQTQQDTSTSPNTADTPDVDTYLDLLAYHFDQSDNASKARDYLSRAGSAAQARYDNQTAIGYYQKVLAYLEREQQQLKNQDNRIENARQRVDILLDLGRVLQLVGEWDLAQTYFEEALRCGQNDCQQASAEAKSAMALGNLLLKRNQYDDAIHWLEHAKQLWEAQASSPETRSSISHIFSELGNIAWRQGDHDHARTLLNTGLNIARAQDDKLNMSHALRILGGIAYVENDYDNARSQFEDALALMRELDNQSEIIKYQSNLGAIAIGLHDYDEAIKRYEESLQLAEAIGAKEQIAGILVNVGVAHSERQDYPKAKALYERALKLYHDMGNPSGAADALLSLGVIANAADDLDEAEQLYRESLRLSSNHKDRVVILTFNLAIVLEKRADLTSSQRYFAKSVQVAQQIGDTLGVAYGITGIARTRLHLAAHLDTPPADIAPADIPTESGNSHRTATFHDTDAETSLILCAATSAILEQHGLALNQDEHDKLHALITDLRQHFAERAETLWQRGIQLSTDQAVTLALSSHDGNQDSNQGSNQGSDSDNHYSSNENAKDTNPISDSANSEDKDTPSADAAPDHTQQIGG